MTLVFYLSQSLLECFTIDCYNLCTYLPSERRQNIFNPTILSKFMSPSASRYSKVKTIFVIQEQSK